MPWIMNMLFSGRSQPLHQTRPRVLPRASIAVVLCSAVLASCKLGDIVDVQTAPSVPDPKVLETYNGAIQISGGALNQFALALSGDNSSYTILSGAVSDELETNTLADARRLHSGGSEQFSGVYAGLHNTRIRVQQGIGALHKYASGTPKAPPAFTGRLFALGGYTEILLGEAFCAGVPLSSAPFEGDIEYGKPLTTAQLFQHALTQLDSAVVYSADSARMLNLARVGRGRALLNLGQFAAAAAAVAAVPTSFTYLVAYAERNPDIPTIISNAFATASPELLSVQDQEGVNGLNFVSAGDPRTATESRDGSQFPLKYPSAAAPVVLADGIEARLIEAEAALQANDITTWAAKLNDLRATAIIPALPALTADSTTTASAALRVDVLFRERAFWLFLTGHRMGDLRRLVRQYGRPQHTVFPVGGYSSQLGERPSAAFLYGTDVTAPIPRAEVQNNIDVTGCLNGAA